MTEPTQADRDAAARIYQIFRDYDAARWASEGTLNGDRITPLLTAHREASTAALQEQLTQTQDKAEKLAEALNLAANRLARCALDPMYGTEKSYQWQEWATEARQAITEWSAK